MLKLSSLGVVYTGTVIVSCPLIIFPLSPMRNLRHCTSRGTYRHSSISSPDMHVGSTDTHEDLRQATAMQRISHRKRLYDCTNIFRNWISINPLSRGFLRCARISAETLRSEKKMHSFRNLLPLMKNRKNRSLSVLKAKSQRHWRSIGLQNERDRFDQQSICSQRSTKWLRSSTTGISFRTKKSLTLSRFPSILSAPTFVVQKSFFFPSFSIFSDTLPLQS
jgi:hypothetical protein